MDDLEDNTTFCSSLPTSCPPTIFLLPPQSKAESPQLSLNNNISGWQGQMTGMKCFVQKWHCDPYTANIFRCASISWFEVVSQWVSHLPFSASASTGLSELFLIFCNFQTLNPWFPTKYAPVSTPSSYCILYRVILDTGAPYWTKYTLCIAT